MLPMDTPSSAHNHTHPPPPNHAATERPYNHHHQTSRDTKWFQELDERYLIPLFSNATASRTFHARRAMARRSVHSLHNVNGDGTGNGVEEFDYMEDDYNADIEGGPIPQRTNGPTRNISGSLIDFFESMRRGATGERARTSEEQPQPSGPQVGHPQYPQSPLPGQQQDQGYPASPIPDHVHRTSSSVSVGRGTMHSPIQRSGSAGAGQTREGSGNGT